LVERALEVLRRSGNPFRNYFARNPDDEVCGRYHVPELFAVERDQLLGVVDLYRYEPTTHSEVVPILGNKGAGKTHLLHSIKHDGNGAWQLLVTPGTYHKDTDFLEYLLFQIIDTLLSGGTQQGSRPIQFVGQNVCRRLLRTALEKLTPAQRLELFPPPGLGRWARRLGLGKSQAQERIQWVLDQLGQDGGGERTKLPSIERLCSEAEISVTLICDLICAHINRAELHDTAGLMRRNIYEGFVRAALQGDESGLANFLTYGFAELDFQVRPSRQDLVLALLKVLTEVFLSMRLPVVVAFDQLEDLLLARRTDDGRRIAEAFFAGIVQTMHQVGGICFLIFAERGLWNRFVPSLDGYISDRLNNPIHVPGHGTIKTLRLEAPAPELVRRIVAARLRPSLEELPDFADLPAIFPFDEEQILRVARTEPTLRDMLQQFRHLFDHLVYVSGAARPSSAPITDLETRRLPREDLPAVIKSVVIVDSPGQGNKVPEASAGLPDAAPSSPPDSIQQEREGVRFTESAAPMITQASRGAGLAELWNQEIEAARVQLQPEGALTGATRELQAGLGKFLQVCHEHGVKVGPWRLQHVLPEFTFGEHPTYGVLTIGHWVCKDSQPWKVGVGLFLGRGPGKPKDLETKLSTFAAQPPAIDHLILLRPGDDLTLSGKSKALWQDAERRGHHARLEALSADNAAALYGFGRWLAAAAEAQPEGQPLPNLAEFLQEKCERLVAQFCMPVQE
jgi:hypothetical protein